MKSVVWGLKEKVSGNDSKIWRFLVLLVVLGVLVGLRVAETARASSEKFQKNNVFMFDF